MGNGGIYEVVFARFLYFRTHSIHPARKRAGMLGVENKNRIENFFAGHASEASNGGVGQFRSKWVRARWVGKPG